MPVIPSMISNVVVDPLTVTATTSQQSIPVSAAVNGYGPITVNAVDSSIDSNITAANINLFMKICCPFFISSSFCVVKPLNKSIIPTITNTTGTAI